MNGPTAAALHSQWQWSTNSQCFVIAQEKFRSKNVENLWFEVVETTGVTNSDISSNSYKSYGEVPANQVDSLSPHHLLSFVFIVAQSLRNASSCSQNWNLFKFLQQKSFQIFAFTERHREDLHLKKIRIKDIAALRGTRGREIWKSTVVVIHQQWHVIHASSC